MRGAAVAAVAGAALEATTAADRPVMAVAARPSHERGHMGRDKLLHNAFLGSEGLDGNERITMSASTNDETYDMNND